MRFLKSLVVTFFLMPVFYSFLIFSEGFGTFLYVLILHGVVTFVPISCFVFMYDMLVQHLFIKSGKEKLLHQAPMIFLCSLFLQLVLFLINLYNGRSIGDQNILSSYLFLTFCITVVAMANSFAEKKIMPPNHSLPNTSQE
jgi:amino acid transporter